MHVKCRLCVIWSTECIWACVRAREYKHTVAFAMHMRTYVRTYVCINAHYEVCCIVYECCTYRRTYVQAIVYCILHKCTSSQYTSAHPHTADLVAPSGPWLSQPRHLQRRASPPPPPGETAWHQGTSTGEGDCTQEIEQQSHEACHRVRITHIDIRTYNMFSTYAHTCT